MRQAGAMLSSALTHVNLAQRVLEGWVATKRLPPVIADADDRAEAAAQLARDLLLRLQSGSTAGSGVQSGVQQLKPVGVSPAQLARLGVAVVSEASPLLAQRCSICLADFAAGESLRCMPVRCCNALAALLQFSMLLVHGFCCIDCYSRMRFVALNLANDFHVRYLQCAHYHHQQCLDEWLSLAPMATCPLCQHELVI